MIGANRKRKHRRGNAILSLYTGLQVELKSTRAASGHMRPYYEMMQRAYMKNRKTRRKTKKNEEPENPKE